MKKTYLPQKILYLSVGFIILNISEDSFFMQTAFINIISHSLLYF